MNKRRARHLWKQFHAIHASYFLTIAFVAAVICLVALRDNNRQMVKLRQDVYSADKNDGDVQASLAKLQHYVTRHMNTGLSSGSSAVYPPVQLQYTYQRLVTQRAAQASNSDLYTEAQAYCQQQNSTDFSGRNRVPCISQYVTNHGSKAAATVSPSLYQFDFVAPKWSPDVAGWSLVIATITGVIGLAKFAFDIYLKRRFR